MDSSRCGLSGLADTSAMALAKITTKMVSCMLLVANRSVCMFVSWYVGLDLVAIPKNNVFCCGN